MVTACLLHNEPTSYSSLARLSTSGAWTEAKASFKWRLVSGGRRETFVIYPWAGWRSGNTDWRTEPIYVEKCPDDLWVGVKGQSNWEIARTLRNAFWCSLWSFVAEVELLIGCEGFTAYQIRINSECRNNIQGVSPRVLRSVDERGRTQTIS